MKGNMVRQKRLEKYWDGEHGKPSWQMRLLQAEQDRKKRRTLKPAPNDLPPDGS